MYTVSHDHIRQPKRSGETMLAFSSCWLVVRCEVMHRAYCQQTTSLPNGRLLFFPCEVNPSCHSQCRRVQSC